MSYWQKKLQHPPLIFVFSPQSDINFLYLILFSFFLPYFYFGQAFILVVYLKTFLITYNNSRMLSPVYTLVKQLSLYILGGDIFLRDK